MPLPISAREANLAPGARLDRYELLCPYAQGGMAMVWLARLQGKHGFEKLVAIKTMNRELAGDPTFRMMLLDEARIAAKIRHPNVAEIDDLGEEGSTLYLVMEWIDGDSLARLHQAILESGQPFPLALLLRVVSDTCAGLHAAHGLRDESGHLLNVVHRDVSPQNVLISTAGVTKVIDFGIAKARDRVGERTKTGMLKGKVEYAAPEQVHSRAVDARTDVWGVGVMMYQILTGTLPFQGRNELETLKLIASGRPPPAPPPTVPREVSEIVFRALRANPDERFQTALDMQRAIDATMTQPFGSSDVAAFLSAYLSPRIEERRQLVLRAKQEANQRVSLPRPPQPLPTAPPIGDWVAQASMAPQPLAQPSPAFGGAPSLATRPLDDGGSRVTSGHKTAMAVTTVLATFVWGLVAMVLVVHPSRPAVASPSDTQQPASTTTASATAVEAPKADPPKADPPKPAAPPPQEPPKTDPPKPEPPAPKPEPPVAKPEPPRPAPAPPVAAPPATAAAKPPPKPAGKKPKVDDGF